MLELVSESVALNVPLRGFQHGSMGKRVVVPKMDCNYLVPFFLTH